MCELSKHTFSLYLHSTTWYRNACWAQQQVRRQFTTYYYFRPTHTAITELIPKECSKCCASIFGRYIMWLLMAYTHCSYTKQSIRVCVVFCVYKCDLVPTYGTANRIEHRLLLPNKLYIYICIAHQSRDQSDNGSRISTEPERDHLPHITWWSVSILMMIIHRKMMHRPIGSCHGKL